MTNKSTSIIPLTTEQQMKSHVTPSGNMTFIDPTEWRFTERADLVLMKSDSLESARERWFELKDDWDAGSDEFKWYGISSNTGECNYVAVDWERLQLICFMAGFGNRDDEYHAHPKYEFDLLDAQGQVVVTIDVEMADIADSDFGAERKLWDVPKYRSIGANIEQIHYVGRSVSWTYL